MAQYQVCKQCGEAKEANDANYRPYYAGRKGRYKVCKVCERINTRFKYLKQKVSSLTATVEEHEEWDAINKMYDFLEARGLQVPSFARRSAAHDHNRLSDVERIMTMSKQVLEACSDEEAEEAPELLVQVTPANTSDLTKWLYEDLSSYSPEELFELYDQLRDIYRPVVGHKPNTFEPIYNEDYKDLLDKVLERFDEYEEAYYD